jgi:hypothetical protein
MTTPAVAVMLALIRKFPIVTEQACATASRNEGADDADNEVADEPETAATHQHAGEPAPQSNQQQGKQADFLCP